MKNQTLSQTTEQSRAETQNSNAISRKGGVLLTTVLLIVAIFLCVLLVGQILGKGYVSVCGYSVFRVATGSMEPELPVGTILLSKQTPISEIAVGDIVNFHSKSANVLDMVITHRVINVLQAKDGKIYLETKGDANQYPDASYVDQNNLIGVVTARTSEGSLLEKIIGVLTSPLGFLTCLVLPCLIIAVLTVRDCIGNIRKEIDSMTKELQTNEAEPSLEQTLGSEEYKQLCDRLHNELLEELKQGVDQVETTE